MTNQAMRKNLLILFCSWITIGYVLAEEVVQPDAEVAVVVEATGDLQIDQAQEQVEQEPIEEEVEVKPPVEEEKKVAEIKPNAFFDEYLAKYFPKAFVMRDQFIDGMPLEGVIAGLQDCVKLLSENPRFYIANKEENIRFTHYWEFILDQLILLHNFFRKAYVNLDDKKILLIENKYVYLEGFSMAERKAWLKAHELLIDYLFDNNAQLMFEFYALTCDYIIKLFNEGILLQDHALANKFYRELEFAIERLARSPYEFDYQESSSICKQLLAILKNKDNAAQVAKFDEKHKHDYRM